MPLRDHFRPPLDLQIPWDGFHGQWPAMIVLSLVKYLPDAYVAIPMVHLGASAEVDVGTYEDSPGDRPREGRGEGSGGGTATAVWAPPRPTLAVPAQVPRADEYAVRVYDNRRGRRLVAAVELVSPSNKDRPERRRAFVGKCAAMLQERVCVAIVDVVTTRASSLYVELLDFIGQADPSQALPEGPPAVYAAACRWTRRDDVRLLETWAYPLAVGQPLPTLPLWLTDALAVPLELEASYEETCRALRIA